MLPRRISRALALVLVVTCVQPAAAASTEELEEKLRALQEQVDALRQELERSKAERATPPVSNAPPARIAPAATTPPAAQSPMTSAPEPPAPARPYGLSDFKLGGYGSTRFEASDLNHLTDTFTFRRFVLTGDATIGERLRSLVELELERLTELEVERGAPSEGGRRGFSQS